MYTLVEDSANRDNNGGLCDYILIDRNTGHAAYLIYRAEYITLERATEVWLRHSNYFSSIYAYLRALRRVGHKITLSQNMGDFETIEDAYNYLQMLKLLER